MSTTSKNIVLVGFMGSGKSSVGAILSERLGWPLVDTDDLVEVRAGRPISAIFEEDGETTFRDFESEAVREAASRSRVVISTGGGVVLRPENVAALKKTGVLFLLDVTPEAVYARVADETHRPLLQVADPLRRIREMLDARRPFYAQADRVIDTTNRSVEEIADEILRDIGAMNGKTQ